MRMTKSRRVSLTSGRPPLSNRVSNSIAEHSFSNRIVNARRKSSKATRTLINTHHQLCKSRAAALAAGNQKLVDELNVEIEKLGGLEAYQAASLTGQDKDRGGDSSEKLVEWLRKHDLVGLHPSSTTSSTLHVLEVGALSSKNAISRTVGKGVRLVKRIDLHSQEPEHIQEVDLMKFPIPTSEDSKYDIVSLSLVLNYVPDAAQRGKMLQRTTQFLRRRNDGVGSKHNDLVAPEEAVKLPLLFVVLPLPCLTNSRYMTHDHFIEILESLGYALLEHHESQKLSYMLFKWISNPTACKMSTLSFKKTEINPGRTRNNFAVILGDD